MYSLNVPVPGTVAALARDLGTRLGTADVRVRGEHTLVAKRLGRGDAAAYHELEARAREALRGEAPFEVRVAGVDAFTDVPRGEGPVVYLAVESPGLESLHDRLCDRFDPVDDVEGDDYVPHVTVARGGSVQRAADLRETPIEPIDWTVERLQFWDAEHSQSVSAVSLG
ncbi:2'-5' RNA ligase family protein [Halosimplex litoreum]|uniref:2'-5' RNA ligase family protein n=1 Tax=Halosimplex litoreum TaxID=1198301 RepID=A0A7U3WAF6_9EURY|nr:2'-5' RNA ligase family protein [Halosimplex litoreum]QPV64601.1 2'-5' RNA ligase family protein [Halosimplex litoreum]